MTFTFLGMEVTPFVLTVGILIAVLTLFVLFMLVYFIACRCCCCSLCAKDRRGRRSWDRRSSSRKRQYVTDSNNNNMVMAMRADLQSMYAIDRNSPFSAGYAKTLYPSDEPASSATPSGTGANAGNPSLYTRSSSLAEHEQDESLPRSDRSLEFVGITDLPALPENYAAYSLPHYYFLNEVGSVRGVPNENLLRSGNHQSCSGVTVHPSHFRSESSGSVMSGDSGSLLIHPPQDKDPSKKKNKKSLFKFGKKRDVNETDSETDYFQMK